MKTPIIKYALLAGAALTFASCIDSETPDSPTPVETGYGHLAISSVDVIGDVVEKDHGHHTPPQRPGTRAEVSPADFRLSITDTETGTEVSGGITYSEFVDLYSEEPMTLPVGSYRIDIRSHEHTSHEWDRVHYSVSHLFDIEEGITTQLGELVCKVSSILVAVKYTPEMLEALEGNDYRVEISIGDPEDYSPLQFLNGDGRIGSFVAKEDSYALNWDFYGTFKAGTFEDQDEELYIEQSSFIKNVKAGELRTLTFSAEFVEQVEQGDATFQLVVSAECTAWNVNLDVEVEEEDVIAPLPGDDEPGPGGDEPGEGVTITGDGISAPLDITAAQAGSVPVVINISAPEGIAELLVDIDSTNAGFGEVATGLGILNLTEPGEARDLLDSVGLPYGDNVKGKTTLSFPITSFVPMIFMTAGSDPDFTVDFKITVKDTKGATNTKTVKLHLTQE